VKKLFIIFFLVILSFSLTAQEDWAKGHPLIDATVLVASLGTNSMGTGFFVTPTGYIITAAHVHVVSDYGTTAVMFPDPPYFQTARIVYKNELNDWAILKVPQRTTSTPVWNEETGCFTYPPAAYPFLLPGSLDDLELGAELLYCGHPAGISWLLSKGILSGVKYDQNGRQYIFSDIAGYMGASGSAIVDSNFHVIGILQQGLPGLGAIGVAIDDIKAIAEAVAGSS